jgi:hypothetical protein
MHGQDLAALQYLTAMVVRALETFWNYIQARIVFLTLTFTFMFCHVMDVFWLTEYGKPIGCTES